MLCKKNILKLIILKYLRNYQTLYSDELLQNTNVSAENFWLGLEKTLDELAPKNKELIKFREDLQKKIDDWHIKNKGKEFNLEEY